MAGVIKRNMASANECLFTPFLINIHVKLCQLATDESLNLQIKYRPNRLLSVKVRKIVV